MTSMFKFQVGDELVSCASWDDPYTYKVIGVGLGSNNTPIYRLRQGIDFPYPKELAERYLCLKHPREELDDLYI